MAFGEFLSAFTGAFQATQQQRFQNELLKRRQEQEEKQFDRQMQLAQLKMDQEDRQYQQQQERQATLDKLAIQSKQYEAGVEAKNRSQDVAIKAKGLQFQEAESMRQNKELALRERQDRMQNQVRGLSMYTRLGTDYDKKAKELMDLSHKRGMAQGMAAQGLPGAVNPELDIQFNKTAQDLLGIREQMSTLGMALQGGMEGAPGMAGRARPEQIPARPWRPEYGGAEGIPGGGEAEGEMQGPPSPEGEPQAEAPPAEQPSMAAPQAAAPTEQPPEAYPGARYMGGRPQPATTGEAAERESELEQQYKAIGQERKIQIQSLEEKGKGQVAQTEDLQHEAATVNRFFQLNSNTKDVTVGVFRPATAKEGELRAGTDDPQAALFQGAPGKPKVMLDPHAAELSKGNHAKRFDIANGMEKYVETTGNAQPALGRGYNNYVVGPLVEQSLLAATPTPVQHVMPDGSVTETTEDVVMVNPFDVLKRNAPGQQMVLAEQANRKGAYMYKTFGIMPSPLPPKLQIQKMSAGEVLDRTNEELFEAGGRGVVGTLLMKEGGSPPSATLAIMDQMLQPDQPDGTYSPQAQQKIQQMVDQGIATVDQMKQREQAIASGTSGYLGKMNQVPDQVRTAENVLKALQTTQMKMRDTRGALQAPRVPPNLVTPELKQFGGMLEKMQGPELPPEKRREDLPAREGVNFGTGVGMGGGGGMGGMRGAITMATMAGLPGGQAPPKEQAPTPKAETPPAKELVASPEKPTEFVKTLGSIGANTKDKNTVAQAAVGTLKGEYNKMKPEEKTAAQKSWQGTRAAWQNLGVKPGILMDLNEAVGLDRMDGLEKEAEKKLKEEEEKASAKTKAARTEAEKKIVRDKAEADKKLREDRAKAREKAKGMPKVKG